MCIETECKYKGMVQESGCESCKDCSADLYCYTASVMGAVDWKLVASASVLAGILSIATSVAVLPECEECKEE